MATSRDQIEHLEHWWIPADRPWKNFSKSRRWLKRQMNRYMRRLNKKISLDDAGYKQNRKPVKGWEY